MPSIVMQTFNGSTSSRTAGAWRPNRDLTQFTAPPAGEGSAGVVGAGVSEYASFCLQRAVEAIWFRGQEHLYYKAPRI